MTKVVKLSIAILSLALVLIMQPDLNAKEKEHIIRQLACQAPTIDGITGKITTDYPNSLNALTLEKRERRVKDKDSKPQPSPHPLKSLCELISTVENPPHILSKNCSRSYSIKPISYYPKSGSANDPLRTNIFKYFRGPNMNRVPLRGIGYYPYDLIRGKKIPLVLIVHGNQNPKISSYEGFDYLTKTLAENGIIAISIDQNFLNGCKDGEMDARAIVILRHLQKLRDWSNKGHEIFEKIDFTNIGLCGHSRGGEAIVVANLFNKTLHVDDKYSDNNFNFNIKALFAIAPVDGLIEKCYSGVPIVLENVNYYIMQGSSDGDVFTFDGQKTYDRAFPNAQEESWGSKGLIYVQGANHYYFNQNWVHQDDSSLIRSFIRTGDRKPRTPRLSKNDHLEVAKIFIGAFFQNSFFNCKHRESIKDLLRGELKIGSLIHIKTIHQYCDSSRIDLNNFEKNKSIKKRSHQGIKNNHCGFKKLETTDITGLWDWTPPCALYSSYYTWNQTCGLLAEWINDGAFYEIELPNSIRKKIVNYPFLSFRIGQVYETKPTMNLPGAVKDISLQVILKYSTRPMHEKKIPKLPHPLHIIWDHGYCTINKNVSKTVMQTIRIPLAELIDEIVIPRHQLSDISKIRFNFNGKGLIVIDDIQFSK